jgi:hypothetical protein
MITIPRKDIKRLKPTALKPANVQHHDGDYDLVHVNPPPLVYLDLYFCHPLEMHLRFIEIRSFATNSFSPISSHSFSGQ